MARYYLTKKAVSDLTDIWEYTFNTWSEQQADNYYNLIVATIKSIAEGHTHADKEYSEVEQGLFCHHCKKHLIFYHRIENNDIEVIRILHERMDITTRINST